MSESHSNSEVEYRPIPGFPNYRAGSDGTIWTRNRKGRRPTSPKTEWMQMKPGRQNGDYLFVILWKNGKSYSRRVHQLVLRAFRGEPPEGHQTRHLDGSRDNNALSNLAWGTAHDQHRDRDRHGTYGRGELHSQAKLTEAEVLQIRARAAEGIMQKTLAEQYGVTSSAIHAIVHRCTWTHI